MLVWLFFAQSNRVVHLPEEIGSLARLKTLDVSNNDLADLPAALGYLPELHRLAVDGNPLRTIRRSLLSGGASSLKVRLLVHACLCSVFMEVCRVVWFVRGIEMCCRLCNVTVRELPWIRLLEKCTCCKWLPTVKSPTVG